MVEEIGTDALLPLLVITTAALLFVYRHKLKAGLRWLGFKGER